MSIKLNKNIYCYINEYYIFNYFHSLMSNDRTHGADNVSNRLAQSDKAIAN